MNLTILYRGPLSSCNFDCWYCPFAKRQESAAELARDRAALERFVAWVENHPDIEFVGQDSDPVTARQDWNPVPQFKFRILFTPWGEALVRRWYQDALVRLTALSHVPRVAIQTNLSCPLDWVDACDKERLALWTTYHPGEVERPRFIAKCHELDRRGVRYSVGVVGLKEHADGIEALRRELPANVYLWINAYKDEPQYYCDADVERFTQIDPLFPINNIRHPSLGKSCRAGHTVISVDGDGIMRRCHFIKEPLGCLYDADFAKALMPRVCTNATCGCHIGYVHLEELGLDRVFGDGILERIPASV